MTLATPPEPTIVADTRLTLTRDLGDVPRGSLGTAWDKPSIPLRRKILAALRANGPGRG